MSSFPPTRSHAPLSVPPAYAQKLLSTYITLSNTHAYLLPNAHLTASGPTSGSSTSITLRNLQRVEAGLRGEWLAPVVDLEVAIAQGKEKEGKEEEGWQNLEDYQLEQEDVEGEVVGESTVVAQTGEEEEEDGDVEHEYAGDETVTSTKSLKRKSATAVVDADVEAEPKAKKSTKDKEARKQEKKEKLKRERREKEEKRKADAAQKRVEV
ncbi:hypothetical protein HYFRA_00000277 [Hymenoscyphus fraxineus]|uniref:Uncharacterized protein n=1 Tax=Hymenoscyphus fraxineus TaxID=746836 RepID=A0A9N9PL54_9HELO|nr:hypothetical protein HYFRA_00000277 [Hymenoscyphus fraxineus]